MTVGVRGVEEPEEASELAEAELLAFWLEELEEPPATPIKINSTTITIMAISSHLVFAFYGNGDRLLHHKEFLTCNICTVLFQGFLSTCDILLLY